MLRLIGLIVVVLLVLSLAHGERGNGSAGVGARADTVVDEVMGRLTDGIRILGTSLFGPRPPMRSDEPHDWTQDFDDAVRMGDAHSRRALAAMVLQACPTLGLTCRQSGMPGTNGDGSRQERRPGWIDPH